MQAGLKFVDYLTLIGDGTIPITVETLLDLFTSIVSSFLMCAQLLAAGP